MSLLDQIVDRIPKAAQLTATEYAVVISVGLDADGDEAWSSAIVSPSEFPEPELKDVALVLEHVVSEIVNSEEL